MKRNDGRKKWNELRRQAAAIEKALSQPQKVCSKSCDQCLFTKNRIVTEERMQEILLECESDQTHFICHKGTIEGINLVCNGFFRNRATPFLELAKAAGRIEFVDPESLSKKIPEKKAVKQKARRRRK